MRLRLLTILPFVCLGASLPSATVAQGHSVDEWCIPGASIDVLANGAWYPSTVKDYPDAYGFCPIHYDGYSDTFDESVGSDRAGPRGERRSFDTPATTTGNSRSSGQPKLTSYHCTFFTSGRLYDRPGFTLMAGGRYRHEHGSSGTYSVNDGIVEFHGGDLDGAAGRVEGDLVRMLSEDRVRPLMDCEAR